MITIYKLTDIKTSRVYVGSTCNLKRRINEHRTHHKSVCKKYGFEEFIITILEETDNKYSALKKEKEWCRKFIHNGENVVCKIMGNSLSRETKERYSRLRTLEFYTGKTKERVLKMAANKSIRVVDQYGICYNSYNECARKIGSYQSEVMNVVKGKSKHTKGYILRREND